MNNLAAGVLGRGAKPADRRRGFPTAGLKNSGEASQNFLLDLEVKDPETSSSRGPEGQETNYFSLNHYTSSEGLLEDFAEIEKISDHMKKHEKPLGETEFGYYLAGLIEGGGNFADQ